MLRASLTSSCRLSLRRRRNNPSFSTSLLLKDNNHNKQPSSPPPPPTASSSTSSSTGSVLQDGNEYVFKNQSLLDSSGSGTSKPNADSESVLTGTSTSTDRASVEPEAPNPPSSLDPSSPSTMSSPSNSETKLPGPQVDIQARVRTIAEETMLNLRKSADGWTETTKVLFSRLGAELNKATGYEQIDALKRNVIEQGTLFSYYFPVL